ncbi:hypothetical protein [Acrocarpospora sp. B8E8]|uniref:hypothetical protein n=1 Tax=Acrocarpospora sp. B8E8 TaxID=3153572 RepID=UPI00325CC714
MNEFRGGRARLRWRDHQEDQPLLEYLPSLREQLRRERFMYLVRLAFALEVRGVSCALRLPGRYGKDAVLEMPEGSSGVVLVGTRRESAGWQYTIGANALGACTVDVCTVDVCTVDVCTVWAQAGAPAGRILRAVSR